MRGWIGSPLLQVMSCRIFGAKPFLQPIMTFYQLYPSEQASVKLESKYKIFIHKNGVGNVACEIAVILPRGKWVKASYFTVNSNKFYCCLVEISHQEVQYMGNRCFEVGEWPRITYLYGKNIFFVKCKQAKLLNIISLPHGWRTSKILNYTHC